MVQNIMIEKSLEEPRDLFYSFIAELFSKEINEGVLAKLLALSLDESLTTNSKSGFLRSLQMMQDFIHTYLGPEKDLLDVLAVDFANIFLGANNAHDGAYPYESVYTSEKSLLNQESTLEVMKTYAQYDFVPSMYYKVPEDHISLEFSFMSELISRSHIALQRGDMQCVDELFKAQQEFFEKHIRLWILDFCKVGWQLSRTDFYKGLFMFTSAFFEKEQEILCF